MFAANWAGDPEGAAAAHSLVAYSVLAVVAAVKHRCSDLTYGDDIADSVEVKRGSGKGRPSGCTNRWARDRRLDYRIRFFDETAESLDSLRLVQSHTVHKPVETGNSLANAMKVWNIGPCCSVGDIVEIVVVI